MYAVGGIKDVLSLITGACVVMAVVLALFGIETNRRSLEEIAPTRDADGDLATSSLSRESHH
jgi:MFS transporter, putative metabolite:H+ symporter